MKKRKILSLSFLVILSSTLFTHSDASTILHVRSAPTKVKYVDIEQVVKIKNFFDKEINEKGSITNDFIDNDDGTITDRATGLMWEKNGSGKELSYKQAKAYVNGLNESKFAGYGDWRFPTIEELYTILAIKQYDGRYCYPIFECHSPLFWSGDTGDMGSSGMDTIPQKIGLDIERGTADTLSIAPLRGQPVYLAADGLSNLGGLRAVRSLDQEVSSSESQNPLPTEDVAGSYHVHNIVTRSSCYYRYVNKRASKNSHITIDQDGSQLVWSSFDVGAWTIHKKKFTIKGRQAEARNYRTRYFSSQAIINITITFSATGFSGIGDFKVLGVSSCNGSFMLFGSRIE